MAVVGASLTRLGRHSDLLSERPEACLAGPPPGWRRGQQGPFLRLEVGPPGGQVE